MYKIAEYADRIALEDQEIKEKYEIIKSLSQDFTVPNEIALKMEKEILKQLKKEEKEIEIDVPEIELRYLKENSKKFSGKITSSIIAANFCRELMRVDQILLYEQFVILLLNRSNDVIGYYRHSKGGVSGTVVDIRLILLAAIKSLASGLILCHNHPSGTLRPSEQDKIITTKLKSAAKSIEITVLDHIIVTSESYFSFSDEGILGINEVGLAGTYQTDEYDKFNYVDDVVLKNFIKLSKKLKF